MASALSETYLTEGSLMSGKTLPRSKNHLCLVLVFTLITAALCSLFLTTGALAENELPVITVTPSATVVPFGAQREFAAVLTPQTERAVFEWALKAGSSLPEGTSFDSTTGKITAGTKSGVFTLNVKSGSASADVFVSVEELEAKGITLSQSNMSLVGNETGKLTAYISPANTQNKKISWDIKGTNSVDIMAISDDEFAFKYAGEALTKPLYFEVHASVADTNLHTVCNVTVSPAPSKIISADSITLSAKALNMFTAEEAAITAQISPTNATGTLKWESSNRDIAIVTSNGTAATVKTMGKAGEAVITATFTYPGGGTDKPLTSVAASCDITAKDAKTPKETSVTSAEIVTLTKLGIAIPISVPSTSYGKAMSDDIAIKGNPASAENIIKLLEPEGDGTRKLIKSDVSAKCAVTYENIATLPVIAANYSKEAEKAKIVILKINVSGISLPGKINKIGDLTYFKLRRDTLTYDSLPRVERAEDLADGKWLIRGADGKILKGGDDIDRAKLYEVNVAVQDDGIYDHNTVSPGKVVDPGALAYEPKPTPSGSSGCNAGLPALPAIPALIFAVLRKRKGRDERRGVER